MTHGSLFSGIGGFDLAARWAGWDNLFNCEIDLFCRTVLKYHFPDAEQYGDIKTTDFTVWRDRIDVLSGGFPCQPFSQAGKRKGTKDDRYLWPEMLGVIRSVRPRWVVGENVLGIVNWSKGLVFEQVCSDLEAEGYEVQPFVIPACGVNAPHRRYRTWFVAHRSDARLEDVRQKRQNTVLSSGITSDTTHKRSQAARLAPRYDEKKRMHSKRQIEQYSYDTRGALPIKTWQDFPTQSPVCSRNDGLSYGLDGITFPKWRKESIKAYGNAIVPQVAYRIFETINEYENYHAEQIFKIV